MISSWAGEAGEREPPSALAALQQTADSKHGVLYPLHSLFGELQARRTPDYAGRKAIFFLHSPVLRLYSPHTTAAGLGVMGAPVIIWLMGIRDCVLSGHGSLLIVPFAIFGDAVEERQYIMNPSGFQTNYRCSGKRQGGGRKYGRASWRCMRVGGQLPPFVVDTNKAKNPGPDIPNYT